MTRTLLTLASIAAATPAFAADLHVGTGYNYATVQAAVNAAADYDTVVVHAGTYAPVAIPSRFTHLSIKASGLDAVTIQGSDTAPAVLANDTHLRLKGLRLEAGGGENRAAIRVDGSLLSAGYTATIVCDGDIVGNPTNTDVAVRGVGLAKQAVVWFGTSFTGLSGISTGAVTNIWEDDMPMGIWEDDMPMGIWEDDMPMGIAPADAPLALCSF